MMRLHYRRGGLSIPAAVRTACLAGAEGVALLRDGRDLLIIPVLQAGAGGFLLKQRSPSGDCVVHAGPFFYEHGLDDHPLTLEACWDDSNARLVVPGLFSPADVVA